MNQYRVSWQACPRINNPSRIMVVEALNAVYATEIAKDEIERGFGISWYIIDHVTPYVRPECGRVLSGGAS